MQSEIPLIELRDGAGGEGLPVSICLGAVQGRTAGMLELSQSCSVAADRFMLYIPGVARYLVENGNRVTVELEDSAPEADVRGYLLGSVFGALCHQNGFLPLHASAVETNGQVTAFLGDSGAGKSTMAAFLERAGYRVVSDDICLLVPEADQLRVTPVAGWLKLWRESFSNLGELPAEENRVFSATDKYRRYLRPAGEERLKLSNVVLLARGEVVALEPVSAVTGVAGMVDLTYLGYLPETTGRGGEVFRMAAQALAGARAWRLTVPKRWEAMASVVTLVEQTLLEQ